MDPGFHGVRTHLLFCMLDARPLRAALAGSGAELGLIVSDYVYRNLVCRHPSLVSPDAFRPARFQVKYTRARAWTYLPGTLERPGTWGSSGSQDQPLPADDDGQERASQPQQSPELAGNVSSSAEVSGIVGISAVGYGDADTR